MTMNDDLKESVHETTDPRELHKLDNDNNKEIILDSDYVEKNLSSRSQTSEIKDEETHPEQPVLLSDVEQYLVVSDGMYKSLTHRRIPTVDALLKPRKSTSTCTDESQMEEDEQFSETPRNFLQRTCLNPKVSLQTQLLLAFGSVSIIIISFVVILSDIIAWYSSENLKSNNEAKFADLLFNIDGNSARILAESITPILIPEGAVQILYESVRDRFSGYPNDSDDFVPFFDVDSQTNKYPIIGVTGKSLPLDWQIEANVNDDNYEEHVQDRWSWYDIEPLVSTANAFYIMQGMCDPSVTDPSAFTYLENCTNANNDVSIGGAINPSPTNNQIYRKARSLSPILKALFESHPNFSSAGIFFSNSGAGSGLSFPHFQLRTSGSYPSSGCEWMNTPNPYDPSRPIGTKEEIARCRPEGTKVSSRLYNVLERDWCRDQALNPFKPLVDGPYADAWNGALVMSAGQGIYDRITNEFIGCSYIEWYMDNLEDLLAKSKYTSNSQVSVARFDDGRTVASTVWNSSSATDTVKIYDLDVGLTLESYKDLKALIDYNTTWNATDVREKYDTFILGHDGVFVAIYPIPSVPESYDPSYLPIFLAIMSASEKDIFQAVEDVEKKFDELTIRVVYLSLVVGAIGLVIVLLVIFLMSKALTAPLEYMNSTANEIINHFGSTRSSAKKAELIHGNSIYCYSPRTELDEVEEEFNEMVTSFDFAYSLKSMKDEREEMLNGFMMKKDFLDLYESRTEVKFGYRVARSGNCIADITKLIHLGSNVSCNEDTLYKEQNSVIMRETRVQDGFTSRLFFWTVVLIGTPLLLTTIAISTMVMYNLSNEFRSGIDAAKSFYLEVMLDVLSIHTTLWAHVASSGTSRPTRDLYILTRFASWLLFGALERTASFTQVKTGIEQCKTFDDIKECPFYQENYFCDCAWNDHDFTCSNYTSNTRDRQVFSFICEATDTFANGARNSTSFPNVSYSPQSTIWWDDARTLPGSEKGTLASGYETTYDRLRVISASPVHQVVYNQDIEKQYTISNSIAFEADGLFLYFGGCSNLLLDVARFSSTEANGAYTLRPELCPVGKYGYDPRCRGWYDTGKRFAETDGIALHVTPPYLFAGATSFIGQSATSPLIDPDTKEHVGQVAVDFKSGPILDSFGDISTSPSIGSFPILITTTSVKDSVVGPGFSLFNESARPILELVMFNDHKCNETDCKVRVIQFDQIISSMKTGKSGNTNFTRMSLTDTVETVYIAYAPVVVQSFRQLNSSDFSRGVESKDVLIYSLALAQTEEDLLKPFEPIDEENNRIVKIWIIIFSIIIFLSLLFAINLINVVILSVIGPILVLLDIIKLIKRSDVTEEPSIVNRSTGSKELNSFFNTIHTLYKVARCGNYAFLSGDLKNAYTLLNDVHQLFHRLNNKRAVGVVSNNLGNLLLIVFQSMEEADEKEFCGMTKAEIISTGISFYYDAIQFGEDEYDEYREIEGCSSNCIDFMQHLSNRYYNRGMFLLTVKHGHEQPEELENFGYRDLDIAADLDKEIAEIRLRASWGDATNNVLKRYHLALMRIKGYLMLQEMGYPDTWDVEDMLDDTFIMVKKEIQKDDAANSSLFQTISIVGRIQEIETELIRYKLLKGEVRLAAQIGIRMLVEDEFVFPDAQEKALNALSIYINELMDIDEEKKEELNSKIFTYKTTVECMIEEKLSAMEKGRIEEDSTYFKTMLRRSTIIDSQRAALTMEGF